MAEYRDERGHPLHRERRSNAGVMVAVIAGVILLGVAVLFLTGFWNADVNGGALPKVDVKAEGGELPDVDVKSKELVVGTSKTTVEVPKVETEKKEVDVPTIGVKD